jgi:TolB-like protein/lipopolysaccharide biosynthesis regulator YciM
MWKKIPSFILKAIILLAFISIVLCMSFLGKDISRTNINYKKLAILPFHCVHMDSESEFLGFAIPDQIAKKLFYCKGVVVRPSDAVRKYTSSKFNLQELAQELDVEYIITGNYRDNGDSLQIDVKLQNIPDEEVIWEHSLDAKNAHIFTVPDSICKKIISGLKLQLSPAENRRIEKNIPRDPLAYEYYLRAIAIEPSKAADWTSRIQLLKKSIELDPTFTPAFADLGYAYLQYAGKIGGKGGFYELAEKTLHHAFRMNEEYPQNISFLSSLYAKTGKSEESVELLQKALNIYPNIPSFHSGLGYIFRYAGLMDESIQFYKLSQRLDSSFLNLVSAQSQITKSLIYQKKYKPALASHERMMHYLNQTGQSADEKKLFYGGMIYLYSKRIDRAITLFDSAFDIDKSSVWTTFGQAYKEAALGNDESVLEIANRLEARNIVDGERRYRLVHFYALIGKKEDALRNLKKSIESGFFNFPYISNDPLLDNIRGTKEFKNLLAQAKKRHQAFKLRFEGKL